MPRSKKRNTKILPLNSNEVRHVVGPANDDTVSPILKSEPTREELELVTSHVRGEGSEVDRLGHPLTAKVARLYDILTAHALYLDDEQ
jgi:hypothetical protein